ncbi:PP2C family protein-serine/threonine phosphatase [Streptomyces antimycoticus]|uniref:PP2C family protein-serine/threonine phosphatase n=2 Tax=Streptomyces TaxID=1883 RepID=A0ABD5JPS4_9ACTN|nr:MULTISPECIES: PP2C family protein-serine/threonine phosphatase [Streptomyces]MEE4589079.1 PP2C family protein-serine/threonine phosphatase [Streptomyces sp. DSM 41602]QTI87414.1 serine/threonine-protein phosphatase [Streptomyces sp. AgN23]WJE01896.1 PP2C family protein-serine/threonine phosphatase [Streptomyces antimycoticus]WTA78718.1 serine/threonine-protein phosphatase [Streptomyces antimycoticus]WTB10939.1 serine/threonine-protein phosphatase [Streptomyces antimycoticus]
MADEARAGGRGAGARRDVVGGTVEVRGGWAGLLAMVPVLLLVGGVVLDVFGPVPYAGLPLLSASPLAACMVLEFRGAVITAAVACVLAVCVDVLVNRPLTALVVDLLDVALISVIALWLKWVVQRQGQRFAAVRAVAEVAQRAVLPLPPARVGAVSVATRYECADAEASVGGDFYAVRSTPFGVRALIGDVRGKGLPAVSTMAVATSAFREAAEQAVTLWELAEYMERALLRFAADVGDQPDALERFATAVLVEVSEEEGRVRLHHRGHPPPYLIRGGRVMSLEPSVPGLPLGLGMPEGVDVSGCDTFPFQQGDCLLLVTDGVTEARDRHGVYYEPCTRLAGRDLRTPSEVVDTLVADVTDWTGGRRRDDMAILALAPVR